MLKNGGERLLIPCTVSSNTIALALTLGPGEKDGGTGNRDRGTGYPRDDQQ